ncbi:MAG: hypothetical protein IJO06_11035 [Thermoguttaceae bacterium]|nr:hypothetical protein [Thermoguttaceae bacterium]
MLLRNDASKFRVRRSSSDAVQRSNAALRRRRLTDALAVATFAASFVYASVCNSSVYAQLFQSNVSEAQRYQTSSNVRANAQRGDATSKTPLFSGKFARNVSEKFSREAQAQPRSASRSYAQAPERGAVDGRSPYSTAPGSAAARNASSQRSFNAPNRAFANGYAAAPRSSASRTATSAEALAQASTSRESAQEALAKIPWKSLSPSAREKLASLAKNPTIYRRLPMAGGYCNPELFDFFLAHPHAVVALWRQMGYDDVAMTPAGPNLYAIREKTGTVGRAQILYQDNELTLVYCNGKYQGPVVPRSLDGEMFLVLQTRYTEDPTGRPIVVCRLDAFVDLKNPGADVLARAFSGALGKLADSNFEQTLAFIDNVSQTAETEPGALSASIAGLSELSPEARRLFAAKTSEVARQAQLRARGTYVDYRLLPKPNSPTPTVARILSRERAGSANAALAARSHSATPSALGSDFNSDAASGRAGSAFSRSALNQTPSTFNNFDKPSLAQNSFALSDDAASDYDFEAELDWEDEEPLKVGGARVAQKPVSAPTLVPETSVAKATARPATRFSDALELVELNENVDGGDTYAPATLATEDALLADDESTSETELPLLLDFENELLQEAEEQDANSPDADASPVAKPAPLVAFPTPNAADAVALPSFPSADVVPSNARKAQSNDVASTLPVLVFDAAVADSSPAVSSVPTSDETETLDDVPLLLLPDLETSDASQTLEPAEKDAKRSEAKVALKNDLTVPKKRERVVAPIVPNAKKTSPARPTPSSQTPPPPAKPASPTVAQTPAPVWRAVEPKPAQTQVAPPVAETARAATEKSATFRKPEIY